MFNLKFDLRRYVKNEQHLVEMKVHKNAEIDVLCFELIRTT